jgi:hypothetical protein
MVQCPSKPVLLLEHFGVEIIIKDRTYHILIENVPMMFLPSNMAEIADIEKKAGLTPHTISKARYIKPAARRAPGQRTAHTIFTFNSKEGANQAIKFRLVVAGKKVYRRKLIPEPSRCLKCHVFDGAHIAAECPQENETCGTCGEQHRTSECSIQDPNLFYCKNCDIK